MIVALDKRTGETIWKGAAPADLGHGGADGAGYSSIVISHGAGVKQYVQLVGRGTRLLPSGGRQIPLELQPRRQSGREHSDAPRRGKLRLYLNRLPGRRRPARTAQAG